MTRCARPLPPPAAPSSSPPRRASSPASHPVSTHGTRPATTPGAVLLVVCTAVLVHAFVRFVREGRGTPAPIAPTERLVVGGLYRHVRNPMYVAVVGAIIGQGLLLARPVLFAYAAVAGAGMAAFARWHEEPVLAARYGADYATYRRAVPGWVPRLRPWQPDDTVVT